MTRTKTSSNRQKAMEMWLRGASMSEVGRRLGVSREYIRQLLVPPQALMSVLRTRSHGECEDCRAVIEKGVVLPPRDGWGKVELEKLRYLCQTCAAVTAGLTKIER